METDWQSLAAPGIVLVTLAIFIVRALRRRKSGACGGGCGCATARSKRVTVVKH